MNKHQLTAIVFLAIVIFILNLGFDHFNSVSIPIPDILKLAGSVSTALWILIIFFDKWGWKLPALYPWFLTTPDISGKWRVQGIFRYPDLQEVKKNMGWVTVNQRFSTISMSVDWVDGGATRFHSRVPYSTSVGACAFSAIYEITYPIDTIVPSATRRAGFFFYCKEQRPLSLSIDYLTIDGHRARVDLVRN